MSLLKFFFPNKHRFVIHRISFCTFLISIMRQCFHFFKWVSSFILSYVSPRWPYRRSFWRKFRPLQPSSPLSDLLGYNPWALCVSSVRAAPSSGSSGVVCTAPWWSEPVLKYWLLNNEWMSKLFINDFFHPGWVAQLVGASSPYTKRLWVSSLVGVHTGGNWLMSLSLSLPPL